MPIPPGQVHSVDAGLPWGELLWSRIGNRLVAADSFERLPCAGLRNRGTVRSCFRWAIAQASSVWPAAVTTKFVRVTSRIFCLFLSISESIVSNLLAIADSRPADLRRLRTLPTRRVGQRHAGRTDFPAVWARQEGQKSERIGRSETIQAPMQYTGFAGGACSPPYRRPGAPTPTPVAIVSNSLRFRTL